MIFRERPGLLAPFKRGDAPALEAVYRHYVRVIDRIVCRGAMLADKWLSPATLSECQDLIQETFARAFAPKARLAFDPARPYGPYLTTICRHLLIDHLTKRKRESRSPDLEQALDALVSDAWSNAQEPWLDPVSLATVTKYVETLPDQLKQLHQLRYEQNLSQLEAARKLGLSRQQVRTLEDKLRDGLRAALAAATNAGPTA